MGKAAHLHEVLVNQIVLGESALSEIDRELEVIMQRRGLLLAQQEKLVQASAQFPSVPHEAVKLAQFFECAEQVLENNGISSARDAVGKCKFVVVADTGNHRLEVYHAETWCLARTIGRHGTADDQFIDPEGVASLPNGDLIVCDVDNHRLQIVNISTGKFVMQLGNGEGEAANQFTEPRDVAVLRDGSVVVCDCGNHRLQVVDPFTGTFLRSIGSQGNEADQFNQPRGVCVLPNGLCVVSDFDNHRLQVLDPQTGRFVKTIRRGGAFRNPCGITSLSSGHVVLCDYNNHRLVRLDPMADDTKVDDVMFIGNGIGSGSGQFKHPIGITTVQIPPKSNCIDADHHRRSVVEHVIVTDSGNHRVVEVDPESGAVVRTIGDGEGDNLGQMMHPNGVACCVVHNSAV